MKDEIILFKTAKLAKNKNFNLECLNFYVKPNSKMFGLDEKGRSYVIENSKNSILYQIENHATLNLENVIFAPTQSLLQRWLREVHNIYVFVEPTLGDSVEGCFAVFATDKFQVDLNLNLGYETSYNASTYEQALEKGLFETLKLIKT